MRQRGCTVTRVVDTAHAIEHRENANVACRDAEPAMQCRDESLRRLYAEAALAQIPRLLGAIDRNPYRTTYGCMDRQFWHYRTADFPSEMYQEGALVLAQVYRFELPGNHWQGEPRLRELAVAAIRYAARSAHSDGSCDDYYPFERALGAAVFSLQATTRAYQLLELDDPQLVAWFCRRAGWLIDNDESGRLANHQALAAVALHRVFEITGDDRYRHAAQQRMRRLLSWQSEEGWFDEYGGADPGYQTVTIDCLAKYRAATEVSWIDEPLARAVKFSRAFLHPDGSYGGPYGSRGTMHFYPHGFELLASSSAAAADLADGFLRSLRAGTVACFDDDRLVAHRLGNLVEAYLDWQPHRAVRDVTDDGDRTIARFPRAGLWVRRDSSTHTVISTARGGTFKHFSESRHMVTDAGLVVETHDGRVAVSQLHNTTRHVQSENDFAKDEAHPVQTNRSPDVATVTVTGPLSWTRYETATPLKFIALRSFMLLCGRWCRTLVRQLLQRRLITARRPCPVRLTRTFELQPAMGGACESGSSETSEERRSTLRVTDTIELLDRKISIRRMSFGSDHESSYVAATGVYQQAVLLSWLDLDEYVEELNRARRVRIVREFP